jgi:hypothetical protein
MTTADEAINESGGDAGHGDKKSDKKKNFDHDGFWKDLIERFFYSLLRRATPELYAKADIETPPHFLDKEFRDILNTADPEIHTSPHFADFLIAVPLRNGDIDFILLHVEAQGPKGGNLAERMYHYKCLIYGHYRKEPVALAIITDTRPPGEATFYSHAGNGMETIYRYNSIVLRDLDDDELLTGDNPADLVLYAAKCALKAKEESQKFQYLHLLVGLLAERGWSMKEKRDLMLFMERIINLKDRRLQAQYRKLQQELDKEEKIMYVSLIEREYIRRLERATRKATRKAAAEATVQATAQATVQTKLSAVRKMLERRMPVDVIADVLELPEDEVRGLMN